jgi:hypothetical protein
MCGVPSTVVVCIESIDYFLGMASKLFWKPFATVPVAPIITGTTKHISCSTFVAPPYQNSCILDSFLLPLG